MMSDSASQAVTLAPALQLVLIITFVLFLTVVLGGTVLIRIFRRRRQKHARQQPTATEHVDVWQLHKPPENDDP